MTETQERFLRTILAQVPLDTVVELHLFPPIRRGTLETGVAVIVTELPPPAPVWLEPADDDVVAIEDPALLEPAVGDTDSDRRDPAFGDSAHIDAESGESAPIPDEAGVLSPIFAESGDSTPIATEDAAPADPTPDDDSPYADEPVVEATAEVLADEDSESPDEVQFDDADDDAPMPMTPPPVRMRISTASYRHTIKGVDRGKWAVDVQEEADAPFEAVEAVLRGVRHRSTEPADPELVSRDLLEHLVAPAAVAPAA